MLPIETSNSKSEDKDEPVTPPQKYLAQEAQEAQEAQQQKDATTRRRFEEV